MTHLLGLAVLVLLPECELLLELLNNSRNLALVGRRLNVNLGKLLEHTKGNVELCGSVFGSRGILVLLALLLLATATDKVVLLFVTLLLECGTLDAGSVNSAVSLGGELAWTSGLLGLDRRWIKVAHQTLGGEDLVLVSRGRSLLELGLGDLLLLAGKVLGLLSGVALLADAVGLLLVLLVGAAGLEVLVLDLPDARVCSGLGLVCLCSLVAEGVEVLVDFVLLGLDGVEFLLDGVEAFGEGLGGWVIERLAEFGDLGLEVVNGLLGCVEACETLLLLVERGDFGKGLLLVDQLHHAGVDLLLQAVDLLLDIVG